MPARVVKQYKQLLQQIRNKKFAPVYFLYGKEPFFIDQLAEAIKDHALSESEQEFNLTTLYGLETDPQTIVNTAKRYPMMAERQVVIIKEAHRLNKLNDLVPYLKQPVETTVLVLCYKKEKVDKRTKFGKAVNQQATTFYANTVYDRHIPDWIVNYLDEKGYGIKKEAAALLGQQLGTDLAKISNELDKLMLKTPEGDDIDQEIIEKNIGISRDFNVFELQNALGQQQKAKAQRITRYFIANPKASPFPMTVGALYNFFSKLYKYKFLDDKSWGNVQKKLGIPYKFFAKDYEKADPHYTPDQIEQIIGWLHEYDLRFKGVNNVSSDEGELLQELVYKILHVHSLSTTPTPSAT
jgi:DNA polymerase-3 subunit delta